MKGTRIRIVLGVALALSGPMGVLIAEETAAATQLPVLLIKGEVVSLDTSDTSAALLKVKDRYGFETPIYVTPDAKVMQGEAVVPMASVTVGSSVAVEYNFDVNTAKRHAVSVKLSAAATPAAAAPATPASMTSATSVASGTSASVTATGAVTPAAPAAPTPANTPAAQPAVPAEKDAAQ